MVYRNIWDDMEQGFAEMQSEAFGEKSPKEKTFLDVAEEEAFDFGGTFDEDLGF